MTERTTMANRSIPIGAVSVTDFVKFAGAGGDFNPLHHDDAHARAAGFPSAIAMGMLTASLASRLVTDWVGLAAVRSFDVRFRAPVLSGEILEARGSISQKDGASRSVITFEVVNRDGDVKMTGTAQVDGPASAQTGVE